MATNENPQRQTRTEHLSEYAKFVHCTLDLKLPHNGRLLQIESLDPDGTLRCAIYNNVNLQKTAYRAVSYEWGDLRTTKQIILGDARYTIRQNLYDFLRSLIAQGLIDELLWIDAICIDQLNDVEKNHQVAQMATIYTGAEQVYIWLGLAGDGTERCLAFVNDLRVPVPDEFYNITSFEALSEDDRNRIDAAIYESQWIPHFRSSVQSL
jgi:hypothetical protein